MPTTAPAWALAAQAIDVRNEPHLLDGRHIRVMSSPLLGLPITPFSVMKSSYRRPLQGLPMRQDVTWTRSDFRPVGLPITVERGHPVYAWLPPAREATCCFALVDAEPAGGFEPSPAQLVGPGSASASERIGPVIGGLLVEAMTITAGGSVPVAARSWRPYGVGASTIHYLRISGSGLINDIHWLPAGPYKGADNWAPIGLPYDDTQPRYAGQLGLFPLAVSRVEDGAPTRLALYDDIDAIAPGTAGPLVASDERGRVEALARSIEPDLDRLVADLSVPQWDLIRSHPLEDERNTEVGIAESHLLDDILSATLDHGLARWLGFLAHDPEVDYEDNTVVTYELSGAFAPNWAEITARRLLDTLPGGAVVLTRRQLANRYPDLDGITDMEVNGPFLDLSAVAVAVVGAPPLAPARPVVGPADDRPSERADAVAGPTSTWLPSNLANPVRDVRLPVSGIVGGAVVALGREEANDVTALNPLSDDPSWRRPLAVGSTVGTGEGALADRAAPATALDYRLAQADWFGRWSNWSHAPLAEGDRPLPPRPTLTATYTQADVPDPLHDSPLAGELRIVCPVPDPAGLAPGSARLASLGVRIIVDGSTTTVTESLPVLGPQPAEIVIERAGPRIPRSGEQGVTVTGHWTDRLGRRSEPAEPQHLSLTDQRPPPLVRLPPTLRYSSRPDASGLARIELTWPSFEPQARYRIYGSDETGVRARLVATGSGDAQALLDDLDAAADDAPTRGRLLTDNKHLLTRDMFSALTVQPLERTGPTMTFTHAVSGSLRVLSLYRIVSVSGSNVEADFTRSALIPYGVANTRAPAQPLVSVRVIDPSESASGRFEAELTLRMVGSVVPVTEYRIRRSAVGSQDPLLMPVARVGLLHPPTDESSHTEVVTDLGPIETDPDAVLRPWQRYSWRVEVRGGPEPGGGPSGRWSAPSAAVTAGVVPAAEPAPVDVVAVTTDIRGRVITARGSEDLVAGALGTHTVDLYRHAPGDRERLANSTTRTVVAGLPFTLRDTTGGPPAEAGTTYRVVVTDPIGRQSDPGLVGRVGR